MTRIGPLRLLVPQVVLRMIGRPSVPLDYLCIFLLLLEHLFFHLDLSSLHALSCLWVYIHPLQWYL